jgi:hypothetical protein
MLTLHDTLFKISSKSAPAIRHILEKLSIFLIPLPLFMLFAGTEGLIKNESPDSLASLSAISSGFFHFPGMHTLIIAGAFGVTFIIWFLTRNLWTNDTADRRHRKSEDTHPDKSEKSEELSVNG